MEQRISDNDVCNKRDIPSFIEPRPPLIQNPFMRPRPEKGTNLLELFEDDSETEDRDLVQVYLRLKPHHGSHNLYEVRSDKCLVTSLDTTTAGHGRRTQHKVSRMYTFSRIFDASCSQKEVFERVVKENLKKLPDGQSFTLLTYGASGSGKTYTLMGTESSPGLVPRSLEYVFKLVDAAQHPSYKPLDGGANKLSSVNQEFELQWVKKLRQVSAPQRDKYRRMSAQLQNDMTVDLTNRTKYYVWVSFVEIYNEAIYDLLAPPDKRTKLLIREDATGQVYVKGVTQAFVRTGEEAYDVMVAGKLNLVVAATGVHARSSRSHCIFTITMLTKTDGDIRTSCVRLCDLAGCERACATRNTGVRMQESRAINSSLHVLERCLHMLRRNQRQRQEALVPYRESKLTRLLGSGLCGSRGEAVSIVVTMNPSPQCAQETKHVLSLAAVAKDIQINNTMMTHTQLELESSASQDSISSSEMMNLRCSNERLHFELLQAQTHIKELLAREEERQQKAGDTMWEIAREAQDIQSQYYEELMKALRAEMKEMKEEYEARLADAAAAAAAPPGTPTRFLQTRVSELMTEITMLEDKLSAEILARESAEKEVQHLRSCIEERDAELLELTASGESKRSPSIVKDDIQTFFKPSTTKILIGENITKHDIPSSIHKKRLCKHDSLDVFEELESQVMKDNEKELNSTMPSASQNKLTSVADEIHSTFSTINVIKNTEIEDETQSQQDNTSEQFEHIYRGLSTIRPSEFDLLAVQETELSSDKVADTDTIEPDPQSNLLEDKENIENQTDGKNTPKDIKLKYNLSNIGKSVGKSVINVSDETQGKEEVTEISDKCESKAKTKRCLRLRRRKNVEEEFDQVDDKVLKDLDNIKKEFSDVTMGLPAFKKDVKDIPSPEKIPEADDNLPPLGIQSCPSKSVVRSRRKLFTPRAEPLEESMSDAGDSNERVYVPRPSYHRTRVRRKL